MGTVNTVDNTAFNHAVSPQCKEMYAKKKS